MSIFPTITNLDEFRQAVGEVPGIEFRTNDDGFTVASYYIIESSMFRNEYARECRGITFDSTGKLVCRPFHKFFNLNENERTQERDLDWSLVHTVMDKRDGSMITPVLIDADTIAYKTKRTFTSNEARIAQTNFGYLTPQYMFSLHYCKLGFTPIFELTSPSNRIVVPYNVAELTLLAIRNIETGEYLSRHEIEAIAEEWNVPIVATFNELYNEQGITPFKDQIENATFIEGFVVQFNDGEMLKMKTLWYLSLHHTVTFTTEKNIAEMVLDNTVDDFKSYCNWADNTALYDKVCEIETRVVSTLNEIIDTVDDTVANCNCETPKEFALTYQDHIYFHLLIAKFRGLKPDYAKFFKTNHLFEYSTECV